MTTPNPRSVQPDPAPKPLRGYCLFCERGPARPTCPVHGEPAPESSPDWCGAGLYAPVYDEDGVSIVAESRRMCGLKQPHDWHQDRFDKSVRWKALPPLAERGGVMNAAPEPSPDDTADCPGCGAFCDPIEGCECSESCPLPEPGRSA